MTGVASALDGTIPVINIFATYSAYAALRADGSVVTWGDNMGGDSSLVATDLNGSIDVVSVTTSKSSFATRRTDGKLITWGSWGSGGEIQSQKNIFNTSNPPKKIYLTGSMSSAIQANGSVKLWGFGSASTFSNTLVTSELDGTIPVTKFWAYYSSSVSLRNDGSLIYTGTDTPSVIYTTYSSIKSQLDGTIDVVDVASNGSAFAALRSDGSVIVWGDHNAGGNPGGATLSSAAPTTKVVAGQTTIAAIKADGSVTFWGRENYCTPRIDFSSVSAQLNGTIAVTSIVNSLSGGWAALRSNGSVITWGCFNSGADSSSVASQLDGTVKVVKLISADKTYSNFAFNLGFLALREDGSLVSWVGASSGTTLPAEVNGSIDVTSAVTSDGLFAAIRADGSALSWNSGTVTSTSVSQGLSGAIAVVKIFVNAGAYAALRSDGSVITWGSSTLGGDSSSVSTKINGDIPVVNIFPNGGAFAALRSDGSIVTWGRVDDGGDSSKVKDQLNGLIDVVSISSYYEADPLFPYRPNGGTFIAIRSDGSLVQWGNLKRFGLPNINP